MKKKLKFEIIALSLICLFACDNESEQDVEKQDDETEYNVKFNIAAFSQEIVPYSNLKGNSADYFTSFMLSFHDIDDDATVIINKIIPACSSFDLSFKPGRYKGMIVGNKNALGNITDFDYEITALGSNNEVSSMGLEIGYGLDPSVVLDLQWEVVEFEIRTDMELNVELKKVPGYQIQYINTDNEFPVGIREMYIKIDKHDGWFSPEKTFDKIYSYPRSSTVIERPGQTILNFFVGTKSKNADIEVRYIDHEKIHHTIAVFRDVRLELGKRTIIKAAVFKEEPEDGETEKGNNIKIEYDDTLIDWSKDPIEYDF